MPETAAHVQDLVPRAHRTHLEHVLLDLPSQRMTVGPVKPPKRCPVVGGLAPYLESLMDAVHVSSPGSHELEGSGRILARAARPHIGKSTAFHPARQSGTYVAAG